MGKITEFKAIDRLEWLVRASDAGGGIATRAENWIARDGSGKEFTSNHPYGAIDKAIRASIRADKKQTSSAKGD